MSFKKITESAKNFAENIVDTLKESKIIGKVTSAVESLHTHDFFSEEKSYSNVEFTPYNAIFLNGAEIEAEISKVVKKEKTSGITLSINSFDSLEEGVRDLFHVKYLSSFKFFYSDGMEIKKGDLVYSCEEKTFVVFDLTKDNLDDYLRLLGEGMVIKSTKSLSEIEKFIKN